MITIKRRNGEVIIEGDFDSISTAITKAIADGLDLRFADLRSANLRLADLRLANLRSADLSLANLRSANLRSADLSLANLRSADLSLADLRSADLRSANLRSANLRSADLSLADLRSADLSLANLRSANLRSADLSSANLRSADLSLANLRSANLRSANLRSADLSLADLSLANLRSADLSLAENSDLVVAMTRILPEGDLIGWKKCRSDILVKLLIPAESLRSHAFGRKCRAQKARVLEVIGAEQAHSLHDPDFVYIAGKEVLPVTPFSEDWLDECASGIHFFITRAEAENYIG